MAKFFELYLYEHSEVEARNIVDDVLEQVGIDYDTDAVFVKLNKQFAQLFVRDPRKWSALCEKKDQLEWYAMHTYSGWIKYLSVPEMDN